MLTVDYRVRNQDIKYLCLSHMRPSTAQEYQSLRYSHPKSTVDLVDEDADQKLTNFPLQKDRV